MFLTLNRPGVLKIGMAGGTESPLVISVWMVQLIEIWHVDSTW